MIQTVLLTGATGFIGSYVLRELLDEGYSVIITIREDSNLWRIQDTLEKVKIVDLDKENISKAFSDNKVDAVVHIAAAYTKHHSSREQAEELIQSNVGLTSRLLEEIRINNVPYLITTGTCFEYAPHKQPINEAFELSPYNLYAATKTAGSIVSEQYAHSYGIKIINLRLSPVYGPKDNTKLVNMLIDTFMKKEKIDLSPGLQQWNWTYVGDIARAYLCAVKAIPKAKDPFQHINIGSTKTHSVRNMVEYLEEIMDAKGLASFTKPYPENEIFYLCCDGHKAKKILDWEALVNFSDGLEETFKYHLKNTS